MKYSIKETTQKATTSVKRIVTNGEAFAQAVALLIVAGFSYYATLKLSLNVYALYAVRGAIAIIALRGTYEFIRFLDAERR